jgi:hypothetical protein
MRAILKNHDRDDQESLDAALIDFHQFLLHRLEMLDLAMRRVRELQRSAGDAPPSIN